MTIRVLLVDDHKMFRDGLRSLIEQEPDIKLVAEAENGREALAQTKQHRPHVVLMDITMPELNGVDATRHIREAHPGVGVVALSMHYERRMVLDMVRAGARGYLLKESAFEDLAEAIRSVRAGGVFFSPRLADMVREAALDLRGPGTQDSCGVLSPREREVLQLIAEGATSKTIAQKLGIAVKTVEAHRTQILRKTGLQNVADLTRYAIRERITSAS